MTALLEVAIGLIALYLILSLVVSAVNEGLAGILHRRAAFLAMGIQNLLGAAMTARFFNHGLVRGLSRGGGKPSYVSGAVFSRAVLDLVAHSAAAGGPPASGAAPPASSMPRGLPGGVVVDPQVAAVQAAAAAMAATAPAGRDGLAVTALGQALGVLAAESRTIGDLEADVESWYDEAMDRVSGWYKRRTSVILFFIGVVLVGGLNADTLNIAKTLWTHPDVRSAAVAEAEKVAQNPSAGSGAAPDVTSTAQTLQALPQLHLPLGWVGSASHPDDPRSAPTDAAGWLTKVAGLLITAVALSFGAPFWFDLLKSFVGIRTSGPSPAESSGAG